MSSESLYIVIYSLLKVKKKKLSNRSFVPVRDIAASAVGGQLQTYWTQGDVFGDKICTNSVDTDVSGFRLNLLRTGWQSTPEKKTATTTKKERKTQYCNPFYDGYGNCPYLFTLISSECT